MATQDKANSREDSRRAWILGMPAPFPPQPLYTSRPVDGPTCYGSHVTGQRKGMENNKTKYPDLTKKTNLIFQIDILRHI